MEHPLQILSDAKRPGVVFSGGSSRCAFQVGVIRALRELEIHPVLAVGVSGGVWNAAAIAAGTEHRLKHYWRCFVRMPYVDVRNLTKEYSPFIWRTIHSRTFEEYVGSDRLKSPEALPFFVSTTRIRDNHNVIHDVRQSENPLDLLLASNYLPPFYIVNPPIDGVRYADGGYTNNAPYEKAFEEGCDAVLLVTQKGESEGGIYRSLFDTDHVIPSPYRERTVVIRPRHRLPVSFTERRWSTISRLIEVGYLRAREVLIGERHDDTDWRASGLAPSVALLSLRRRVASAPEIQEDGQPSISSEPQDDAVRRQGLE